LNNKGSYITSGILIIDDEEKLPFKRFMAVVEFTGACKFFSRCKKYYALQ